MVRLRYLDQRAQDAQHDWAIGAISPICRFARWDFSPSLSHLTNRGKVRFNQELLFAKRQFKFHAEFDSLYKRDTMRAVDFLVPMSKAETNAKSSARAIVCHCEAASDALLPELLPIANRTGDNVEFLPS